MIYYTERVQDLFNLDALVDAHEIFFNESIYKDLTWNRENARQSIENMIRSDEEEVIALFALDNDCKSEVVGFFEYGYDSAWMDEEVAMCVNFYIVPWHHSGHCSQKLLDLGTSLCQDRGAKLAWQSSTAGFSDNGVNERAFRMFLKRNGFEEVGALLLKRFGEDNEQD